MPTTCTVSPAVTAWSRPGQTVTASSAPRMTATGASSRNWRRSVLGAPIGTATTTNASRPSSCDVRCRQASTTEGAASSATSSTQPLPVTSATACPTAALARATTGRVPGLSSLTSSAVSSKSSSLFSTHTTATAPDSPARSRVSASRALPTSWAASQRATMRASRGSGWSSITTTGTPARCSCSTVRRPTPSRPHTITCPLSADGSRRASDPRGWSVMRRCCPTRATVG